MILEVIKYGHPVLRQKGAPIATVTPELQQLIGDMFETMHAFKGVGLAAHQVGQAIQLTVLDIRGVGKDRVSSLEIDGQPADPDAFMPLVLINPHLTPVGSVISGGEGCLSFPEIYAEVERAERVDVLAQNQKGETLKFRCGGLLARAIQHEGDHLNGILYIDRMTREVKAEIKPELDAVQAETKAMLAKQRK
ncbi:MAG: Peptide deformylase [Verrucomicrobiota bacterium]|jgi:peptide deformylase